MKLGMVFLHGIGGCLETWPDQLAYFEGRYPLLAWCAPGYGGKARLPRMTFEALADDLASEIEGMAVEKVVLVGHSFGGMVAQQFVKSYPDRVSHLILVGTSPAFGNPAGDFQKRFVADRTRPLDEGQTMAEVAASVVPTIIGSAAAEDCQARATAAMAKVPPETYRKVIQLLTTFDLRKNLPNIAVPTLLLVGEEDRNAPPAMMKKTASYIPGSKFVTMPKIGHLPALEDGPQFNALVEGFLQEAAT